MTIHRDVVSHGLGGAQALAGFKGPTSKRKEGRVVGA